MNKNRLRPETEKKELGMQMELIMHFFPSKEPIMTQRKKINLWDTNRINGNILSRIFLDIE